MHIRHPHVLTFDLLTRSEEGVDVKGECVHCCGCHSTLCVDVVEVSGLTL